MEERKETGGEEKEEKKRRKRLGQGKVRHSHYLEQDGPRLDWSEQTEQKRKNGESSLKEGKYMEEVAVIL